MLQIFFIFFVLGCSAFGGPVAHIGYFQNAFVEKRRWLTSEAFSDLVALCHVLPGPASSQVGLGIGYMRGGIFGALAAWLGFTLPSAFLLTVLAVGLMSLPMDTMMDASRGLGWAVVAIVGHAAFQMFRSRVNHTVDSVPVVIAVAIALLLPGFVGQLTVLVLGAAWGLMKGKAKSKSVSASVKPTFAWVWLLIWGIVLLALPFYANSVSNIWLDLFDRFYRTGSLVFGGGHVVLPLLKADWVDAGLVTRDIFVTGYGAAQAVPGPLFTISAYLGAVLNPASPWWASLVALCAMFLPSMLLIFGILPYAERLRSSSLVSRALSGVNLAVIGLLVAAWLNPITIGAISGWPDAFGITLAMTVFLSKRLPVPLMVGGLAMISLLIPF